MLSNLKTTKIVALIVATVFILSQSNFYIEAADGQGGAPIATNLTITKDVSKNVAKIGEVFEYTLKVQASVASNVGGDFNIENVEITDVLPEHLELVDTGDLPATLSQNGNTVTIDVGTISTGVAPTGFVIPVRFKPDTPVGYIAKNTATVSGHVVGRDEYPSATSSTENTTASMSDETWDITKTATSGTEPVEPSQNGGMTQVWYRVTVSGNTNNGMNLYNVRVTDQLPTNYYMTSYKVEGEDEVTINAPYTKSGELGAAGSEIVFDVITPGDSKVIDIKGYYQDGVSQNNPETNTATATPQYKRLDDNEQEEYVDLGTDTASVDVNFIDPSYGGNVTKYNRNGTSGAYQDQNYDRYKVGDAGYFTVYANDASNIGLYSFLVKDILPPKEQDGYPFIPNEISIQNVTNMLGIPDGVNVKANIKVKKEDDSMVDVGTVDVSTGSNVTVAITETNLKEVWVEYYSVDNSGSRILNPIGMNTAFVLRGTIGISGQENTLYKNKARVIANSLVSTKPITLNEEYSEGDALALFKIEKGKPWLNLNKTGDLYVTPDDVASYEFKYSNNRFGTATANLEDIIFYDYVRALNVEGDVIDIVERDIKKDGDGNYEISASAKLYRANQQVEDVNVSVLQPEKIDEKVYKLGFQCTDAKVLNPGEYIIVSVDMKIDPNARYGYLKDKVFVEPIEDRDDYDISTNSSVPSGSDFDDTDLDTNGDYLFSQASTFVRLIGMVKGRKSVHGDLDVSVAPYTEDGESNTNIDPANGTTDGYWKAGVASSNVVEGGTADYKLVISNEDCNGPISDFILVDKLPRVGDTMIKSGNPRNSKWQPVLINQIVNLKKIAAGGGVSNVPDGDFTVFYSTKNNPNLSALDDSNFALDGSDSYLAYSMNGGAYNAVYDWNKNLPADLTKVKWMMVKYDGILDKDEKLETRWKMRAPLDTSGNLDGKKAYNSFAYGGTYIKSKSGQTVDKDNLLPSEPAAVSHKIVSKTASKIQIGDRVWEDLNKNGKQEAGEPGINGILVLLYDSTDTLVDFTRTANNSSGKAGYYKFVERATGEYTVKFGIPKSDEDHFNDYFVTDKDAGADDEIDSDIADSSIDLDFATDGSFVIGTSTVGDDKQYRLFSSDKIDFQAESMDLDFGLYRKGSIGDRVWFDTNADGIQNNSESGIEGVFVQLIDSSDTVVKTVMTDNNGNYKFSNLDPDNYKLKFINFDYFGNIPTLGGVGNLNADSNISSTLPHTYDDSATPTITVGGVDHTDATAGYRENTTDVIELRSGVVNNSIDAGYTKGLIGNFIFGDKGKDGAYDNGDGKISGVKVFVAKSDSNASKPSAADFVNPDNLNSISNNLGIYGINGLDEGNYDIWFFVPESDNEHYELSTAAIPWTDTSDSKQRLEGLSPADNPITSFVSSGTTVNLIDTYRYGKISNVIVDADNIKNYKYDVGLYIPGKISGKVFEDNDYDNLNGVGDNLIDDATAALYVLDDNGVWVQYGQEFDITDGTYEFVDLPAGLYKVGIKLDPDKSAYGVVSANIGTDDNVDSDVYTIPDGEYYFTFPFDVDYGTDKKNVDAGFRLARIGNKVYRDINFNGRYDADEELIGGATLRLLDADNSDVEVASVITGAGSTYYFEGLEAGNYKVIIEMPNNVDNILSLQSTAVDFKIVEDDANYAVFSDDGSTTHKRFIWSHNRNANNAAFTIKKGENFDKVDFAFVNHGIISGMIFEDLNNNGIRDAGEGPMAGLTVTLTKPDNTTLTTTTDANGAYAFGNLQENANYKVEFEKPNTHVLSPANQGGDDTVDSDAVLDNGKVVIQTITLSSNDKEKRNNDAGYFSGLQIKGKIFDDKNKDGIFGLGENLFTNKNFTFKLFKLENGNLVAAKDIFNNDIAPVQSSNGIYHFKGLPDDDSIDYKLKVEIVEPYEISPYKQGGDDTKDSDFEVDTGFTAKFDMSVLTDGYLKEYLDLGVLSNMGGDITNPSDEESSSKEESSSEEGSSASSSGESSSSTTSGDGNNESSEESTQASSSVSVEVSVSTSDTPIDIEIVTPPEGGEVDIDDDGNITFTPNDDFTGETKVVIKVTYDDGTEEIIEFDITDDMIAEATATMPKTGGVPMAAYLVMAAMPLSAGLVLRKKK